MNLDSPQLLVASPSLGFVTGCSPSVESTPSPATSYSTSIGKSAMRQIPEEIWVKIFRNATKVGLNDPVDILKHITHVCHYWRVVALADPELWASGLHLLQDSPEWVKAVLQRSGSSLLTVRANITEHEDLGIPGNRDKEQSRLVCDNLLLALEHLPRIVHLEIVLDTKLQMHPSLSGPAPELKCLRIWARKMVCPMKYLGDTPRLRLLSLHNCATNLHMPMFRSGLTRLYLDSSLDLEHRPYRATIQSILQVVGASASTLELLVVGNVFTARDPCPGNLDGYRVSLPRLKHLQLALYSHGDRAIIANYLILPANASVTLYSQSTLFHALRILQRTFNPTLHYAEFEYSTNLRLTFWDRPESRYGGKQSRISLNYDQQNQNISGELESVFESIPDIVWFSIKRSTFACKIPDWSRILRRIPNVHTLEIWEAHRALALLNALGGAPGTSITPRTILLPNLQKIIFRRSTFACVSKLNFSDANLAFTMLGDMLIHRKAAGKELSWIQFGHCSLPAEKVPRIWPLLKDGGRDGTPKFIQENALLVKPTSRMSVLHSRQLL